MKICIPVTSSEGLHASLHPEFAAASHLLVFDMQSGEHHTFSCEGNGNPSNNEPEEPIAVDAVLCSGITSNVVRAFSAQGIQVFSTVAKTVAQALESLQDGEVDELIPGGCCDGHQQDEKTGGACAKKTRRQADGKHECRGGSDGCGSHA